MSNTIRIRTEPNGNDKYLKIKLEQDWDFIEILSLKISQEDAYLKFCSDYGAIVGRVIINSGFGVPNAKVSVFIPLDDIDKNDPLISGIYPFEVISDKDSDGIRYNLFPKDNASTNDCYSPIGTFPNKREVLDNDTLLNVYCKYYKFTTTTNYAGDFMIFGVPLGTYTVHVDVDLSDIGIASQRPYDLINQGVSEKLFLSPTKFNTDKNIDKLAQVKTLNAGVNVQPFWGDTENCEIGISRLDFDLNYSVIPSAIFMGSIYGDQDKHSINKHCRPRNKLGVLCEQITGPGSVDMIRKTLDGEIEEYSVNGGRVIDEDGTWAFQIPMNLDYMVTSEDGNLIFSQDPNKGVPTRARVRFKIGMDETGGEGRLRTRAKYLVPNNPTKLADVDYTFNETTKDTSFRDMHWNKIYSVSNYISRFQKNFTLQPEKTRNMIAIKDVDACGDKTPHPYNRVNGQTNPIFLILCVIIKMIGFLVVIINGVFFLLNVIISLLNSVLNTIKGFINSIIGAINSVLPSGSELSEFGGDWTLPYVPCIYVECDGQNYSPGCNPLGSNSNSNGYDAANQLGANINPTTAQANSGLSNCMAFELAKSLNMFQFDFYNDWINGSLFGFLLKYKKKRRKREVFCEYECSGGNFTPIDGIDGNNNGVGDNSCQHNLLMDSCFDNNAPIINWQHGHHDSGIIRDGLIKKVGDEFFYAATTHNVNFKLFATEIINLGSVFNCDWQGLPNIQPLLIPTSYKIPPDTNVFYDTTGVIETTGMVNTSQGTTGLFFTIDCLGLHSDEQNCLNLRHICEIGVNIDETIEDQQTGLPLSLADSNIGVRDIDDDRGRYLRDVFLGLNNSPTPWISVNNISLPYTSDFNLNNTGNYDFTTPAENGSDYINFRGYSAGDNSFGQTKHSYFFYFGLHPGKTALDKMNQRFFTTCKLIVKDNFIIQVSSTVSNNSDGTLTFSFVGGSGPYTYTITGPLNYTITGTANGITTLTGLDVGTYLISAINLLGTLINKTVVVSGPPLLYCYVNATKNSTTSTSNNGEITISSVGGGQGPYYYTATKYDGTPITNNGVPITNLPLTIPQLITGLGIDSSQGYTVIISDSSTPTGVCLTTGLLISGPNVINIAIVKTNSTCYNSNDGKISISVSNGQAPYTITTTASGGYSNPGVNLFSLTPNTYTTTVVDSLGATIQSTNIISALSPQMVIAIASTTELAKQCDPTQYSIPFKISTGIASTASLVDVFYQLNGTGVWTHVSIPYVNNGLMYLTIPSASITTNIKIKFSDTLAGTCFSNILNINKATIQLPSAILSASVFRNPPVGMGPYTYVVFPTGGINPPTSYTTPLTSNSTYSTIISDSVGCTAPATYP